MNHMNDPSYVADDSMYEGQRHVQQRVDAWGGTGEKSSLPTATLPSNAQWLLDGRLLTIANSPAGLWSDKICKKKERKESKSKAADIVQGVRVDWKPEMPPGFSALQWGGDLPGTFQRLTQRLHFPIQWKTKSNRTSCHCSVWTELLTLSIDRPISKKCPSV